MSDDARLRLKWKVDLLSYIKPFRDRLSKPVNKTFIKQHSESPHKSKKHGL